MKRIVFVVWMVVMLSVVLLAACGGTQGEPVNEPANA